MSSAASSSSSPQRRSLFRPCIDLHQGVVKQIVGGTLEHREDGPDARAAVDDDGGLKTNFISEQPPAHYAGLYRQHSLLGGHVIKLGPNNDAAAKEALATWPGGLQVGGGINEANAQEWLDAGASKVIVTSYLFPSAKFSLARLQALAALVGKDRLVVDVSCRKRDGGWWVAMDKWTRITDLQVTKETLDMLAECCSEILVHAADVEGLCQGIDEELVTRLGEWTIVPCTYAGGAKAQSDLDLVSRLSAGKVDLTYGSALDIFGGSLVPFDPLVALSKKNAAWNAEHGFAV